MKITESTVLKLRIEDATALDPIDVFLEDHGPKQGSVTIKCYGESWTTYWGGMWEGLTVSEFFCQAYEDYVLDQLFPGSEYTQPDYDALEVKLKQEVIRQRRIGTMGKEKARGLFNECEGMMAPGPGEHPDKSVTDLIETIFDYCWWDHIPTKTNPKYDYLRRIVKAVREALSGSCQKVAA